MVTCFWNNAKSKKKGFGGLLPDTCEAHNNFHKRNSRKKYLEGRHKAALQDRLSKEQWVQKLICLEKTIFVLFQNPM